MFRKRKEWVDGEERKVSTRYYLRVGRGYVSLRFAVCLLLFVVLLILMITVKPGPMLPVKL